MVGLGKILVAQLAQMASFAEMHGALVGLESVLARERVLACLTQTALRRCARASGRAGGLIG